MVNIQFYKGIMTCRETQAFILWVWEQKELFTVASCVTWVSLASCLFCADEGECLGLTSNLYKYILKRYPYIFSYIFLNDRSKPQVLKEVKWYLIHLIGIGVNRSDGKLARDKLFSSKSFFFCFSALFHSRYLQIKLILCFNKTIMDIWCGLSIIWCFTETEQWYFAFI